MSKFFKIILLVCAVLMVAPHKIAQANEVTSQSGRLRVILRQEQQELRPNRENRFWIDLYNARTGSEITDYTAVSERRGQDGQVHWLDKDGHEVTEGKSVRTHLWMNMGHHGHGSIATQTENMPVGSNRLHITNAFFVMTGRWQVIVTFLENALSTDTAIFNVEVALPPR